MLQSVCLIFIFVLGLAAEGFLFDCSTLLIHWETDWSFNQKAWCCQHAGVGCNQFDCWAGDVSEWFPAKRNWCCKRKRRGCSGEANRAINGFDCEDGYAQWEIAWPVAKKNWCCKRQKRACDLYDCNQFSGGGGVAAWTAQKKAWCCQHAGTGCTSTSELSFDCKDGLLHWEQVWSPKKKADCCRVGAIPTCEPFNCATMGPNDTTFWPEEKRRWCCDNKNVGCSFDCQDGASDWSHQWSEPKKNWCCHHGGVSCGEFNCAPSFHNAVEAWSTEQKQWCCSHHSEGCELSPGRVPLPSEYGGLGGNDLDCNMDVVGARRLWSPTKKVFCCVREAKGCPETTGIAVSEAVSPVRLNTLLLESPRAGSTDARWRAWNGMFLPCAISASAVAFATVLRKVFLLGTTKKQEHFTLLAVQPK